MVEVTLADAHAEACQALGEAIVMQRLLTQRIVALEAAAPGPPVEPDDKP